MPGSFVSFLEFAWPENLRHMIFQICATELFQHARNMYKVAYHFYPFSRH